MTYLLTGSTPPPQPVAPGPRPSGSLKDVFEILFRQKIKIIVFFVAVIAGAVFYLSQIQKTYTSEAKILVRRGRENILLDPTVATGEVAPLFMEWENSMNSEIEILTSRELAAQVVQTLGPDRFIHPQPVAMDQTGKSLGQSSQEWVEMMVRKVKTMRAPEAPEKDGKSVAIDKTAQSFSKALDVKMVPKSNIISISFESPEPALSRLVVATLLDLYHQMHILANRAPGAHEFFLKQTETLRSQLETTEDDLRDLKTRNGIASLDAQRAILLNRIGELQNQEELVAGQIAASRARINAGAEAVRKDAQGGSKVAPLPINAYYKDTRMALQAEETSLAGLLAQAEVLKGQLAAAQNQMRGLNENEIQIARLERDRDMLRDKYTKYCQNLEQTRIDQALQTEKISNISIIQPPTLPVDSNPTNRFMKLVMAGLIGILGSAGVAYLAQHLDHTLKRPEDIEELLGVPALVSIPRLRSRSGSDSQTSEAGQPKRRVKGAFAFNEGKRYYSILRDRVVSLMQSPDGSEQPMVIGITSSHYGEGVSSVSANLALALAENRNYDRVLLVNANKGQPSPHQLFGIKQTPGASEILMDAQGELIVMEQNLYKVPADLSDATPPAGGPLARYQDNLLRLVKDRNYRYVVFDLPPLCEGSSIPLARMMDGVVLVVKAEGVRSEIVMRMKDLLQEVNVRVLGAVLNKRRFYIPGWLYNRL